jgi:hypothetical protein
MSAKCLVLAKMAIGLLVLSLLGCNRAGQERYVPASALARNAVSASLESWASGNDTPDLAPGGPRVQYADSLRTSRTLESFEIVGELPVEEGRRFEVLLTLKDPPGQEKAQYIVLGIDPLWVIRLEDYHMITHWDHPVPKEPAPGPAAGKATNE